MKTQSKLLLSLISAVAFAYAAPEAKTSKVDELFFVFNSAHVSQHEGHELKSAAAKLKANPRLTIRIEGNGDKVGTEKGNEIIALRRAESVKKLLVADGVAAHRIAVISNGKEHMKYKEQHLNRRADVFLIITEAPVAPVVAKVVASSPVAVVSSPIAVVSSPVVAPMVTKEKDPNVYVNINAGSAVAFNLQPCDCGAGYDVTANVGYEFNKYAAVEAGYGYNQFTNKTYPDTSYSTHAVSNIADIAFKGTLALGAGFGTYARAGVAGMFNSFRTTDQSIQANTTHFVPALMGGVGVEYNFTKKWSVRLEDTIYLANYGNGPTNGEFGSLNNANFGVQYKF